MHVVTYVPSKHTFFDELATLFISLSSFNAAIESYWNCGVTRIPMTQDHTLYLYGRFVAVAWQPNQFMHKVKLDVWPAELQVVYLQPSSPQAKPTSNGVPFASASAAAMVHGLAGLAFIKYFEQSRGAIESKFGQTEDWPAVWNFGRTVRNALTHKGTIDIRNPRTAPVAWQGAVIGSTDNGKVLLDPQRYLGVGDLVPLMEEMDAHVV